MTAKQKEDAIVEAATDYAAGFVIIRMNVSHAEREKQLRLRIQEILSS